MTTTTTRALSCAGRVWATAELLPWDEEAFGFPTGQLTLGERVVAPAEADEARASLAAWAEETGAELAAASADADRADWVAALPLLGFRCVDVSLRMTLSPLKRRPRTLSKTSVRPAAAEDFPALVEIASTAFDFGRYHRDALFPRALADRRFGLWVERSLKERRPTDRFWVVGTPGAPRAFVFARVAGARAEILLTAVARAHANGLYGAASFEGALAALEKEGVRAVAVNISALNTGALNLYARLGFRASEPRFTFHWRAPNAPRLARLERA